MIIIIHTSIKHLFQRLPSATLTVQKKKKNLTKWANTLKFHIPPVEDLPFAFHRGSVDFKWNSLLAYWSDTSIKPTGRTLLYMNFFTPSVIDLSKMLHREHGEFSGGATGGHGGIFPPKYFVSPSLPPSQIMTNVL